MSSIAAGRRSVELGAVFTGSAALLKRHGLSIFLVHAACTAIASGLAKALVGPTTVSFFAGFIPAALSSIATVISSAFVLSLAALHESEGRASFSAAFIRVAPRLPILLALSWVVGLAIIGAGIFFIVPGFIVIAAWMLAMPAAVIESRGLRDALGRSSDLTRGRRWESFGVWLIMLVVSLVGGFFAGVLMGLLTLEDWGTPAGTVVAGTLTAPMLAAYFLEVRAAREGPGAMAAAAIFD